MITDFFENVKIQYGRQIQLAFKKMPPGGFLGILVFEI
jgi:hypothetical protein